ncbi:hypothetical protein Cni_G23975 [Canna indica]|uniref:SPRY domain-containing protein n=1 Tax=Canna indica TaxID=4628 RepID=A0AAQ3QL12_9LILI|nr:hypothetical protein Cni_G23975 [Canna indica]
MKLWIQILATALPGAAAIILLISVVYCCYRHRQLPPTMVNPHSIESLPDAEIQSLRGHHHHHHNRQAIKVESPFRWQNDSELAAESADKGWSLFTSTTSSPSACDHFVLCETAFMQTVRLNPQDGRKTESTCNGDDSICTFRMRFPLPGPPLNGFSFPQVAYFEITILYLKLQQQPRSSRAGKRAEASTAREDDRARLINVNSVHEQSISSVIGRNSPIQQPKSIEREQGKGLVISLGLAKGDAVEDGSPPGTYPASIGFQADGSIYLDGMKLVPESEKTEWAVVNKVIGCGFDPRKKKVFFTVDSELVHVIRCTSDVYSAPLFPVMAADIDVMVLVNLGQREFKYDLANAHRTPNSSILAAIDYEDSQEQFPLDRMNAEWLQSREKVQSRKNTVNFNNDGTEFEADSDLFEISLT